MDIRNTSAAPSTGFYKIPRRVLLDQTLSAEARLVLIYVSTQGPYFIIRRKTIQHALNIGTHVWRRVSRELAESGASQIRKMKNPNTGKWDVYEIQISWGAWVDETLPK
jgi:hypothetical protein